MNLKDNKKGITLIALVVTIIVLIILAGVSINVILTDGGIIAKAKEAKEKSKVGELKERLQLEVLESYSDNKLFDYNVLKENLKNVGITIPEEEKYPITINLEGYDFKIDSEGNVSQVCSAIEVANNPKEYYGKYITNYATTNATTTVNWRIFYSDKSNIYIISDDYIPYEYIPYSTKNGKETLNKPQKGQYERSTSFDNILVDYVGTSNISKYELKMLNKNYFLDKNYLSTNNNMKVLAYMMDVSAWNIFQTDKAEYVIGGPTVEMLFNSYNQMHNNGENKYQAIANNNIGYRVSNDGGENSAIYYYTMLDETDTLYVIDNLKSKAWAYNLSSPSASTVHHNLRVSYNGDVITSSYNDKRKSVLDH